MMMTRLLATLAAALILFAVGPAGAFTYATNLKNARLDAVTSAIGANGKMKFFSAGTSSACSGTLLAVLALSATAAPAASAGVLTFGAITADSSADATGTAVCAQVTTAADAVVLDGLTVATSGANINLNSTSISAGQQVGVTSFSITHP